MAAFLETLMEKEIASAKNRNFKVEMVRTIFLVVIFISFSFSVNNAGWAGCLLAILYFWHRYVVMKVAKSYLSPDVKNEMDMRSNIKNAGE
tara:strand:- start:33718 stop:33990 length:273 start_codon:yes stop_codon:yes gene_type:complete